jgi:hypothetical protein
MSLIELTRLNIFYRIVSRSFYSFFVNELMKVNVVESNVLRLSIVVLNRERNNRNCRQANND